MAEVFFKVGSEKLTRLVARHRTVQNKLRRVAEKGATEAQALLEGRRNSGDSQIELAHGDIDYYVVLSDERGQHAAAAIEYGHRTKHSDGKRIGGTFVLHDALGLRRPTD